MTGTLESRFSPRQLDLKSLAAGIIAGILALSADPWWTLTGTSSQIIVAKISPFHTEVNAIGIPSTTMLAESIGLLTRVIMVLASLFLMAAAFRRTAWWHDLAGWFGLSSVGLAYLSLTVMIHSTRMALMAQYGVAPQVAGTAVFPANVLGLDFNYYGSPVLSASFGLPFYVGFACFSIAAYERFARRLNVIGLASLLNPAHIQELQLIPPYDRVWLASDDDGLNPLGKDPENLTDDQLASSFSSLFKSVAPGGLVTVVLPSWAGRILDRIRGLSSWTGFRIERTGIVYRTQGTPELEVKLRKPSEDEVVAESVATTAPMSENEQLLRSLGMEPTVETGMESRVTEYSGAAEQSGPMPILESREAPPRPPRNVLVPRVRLSKTEEAILKAAVRIILDHAGPVGYKELINEVYLELLDRKVEFDSVRQIEHALLDHNGRELVLVEEAEVATGRLVRKWWIGEVAVGHGMSQFEVLERLKAVTKLAETRMKGLTGRFHRPSDGYRSRRRRIDDETSSDRT